MNKKFVIQNELDKKYWHFISEYRWTDDILEAQLFENKQETERYIKNNRELKGISIIVIEVELPFISESYTGTDPTPTKLPFISESYTGTDPTPTT